MCFLGSLRGSLVLRRMIQFSYVFVEYQTGATADHTFEAIFFENQTGTIVDQFWEGQVTLVKLIISVSWIFSAIDQILLQRFTARVLRFTVYDTRYLHFCQISNWSDCRSLF